MCSKPVSRRPAGPALSDSEVPMDSKSVPSGIYTPVATTTAEEANGKKFNGTRMSGTGKSGVSSAPHKNLLRKNSGILGSNPGLVRPPHVKPNAGGNQVSVVRSGNQNKPVKGHHKQNTQNESNSTSRPSNPMNPLEGCNGQLNGSLAISTVNGDRPVGVTRECFIVDVKGVIDVGKTQGDDSDGLNPSTSGSGASATPPLLTPTDPDLTLPVFDCSTSIKIPFLNSHLKFCNQNCSKLHFCLQTIPTPEGVVPSFQSVTSFEVDGHKSNNADGNKSLPLPGIHEALDHLHGLRNFAVVYGLLNTGERYRGFAEIEALILERVQQLQQTTGYSC